MLFYRTLGYFMLLYHKAMLSYTSATIATALRRCPFFQPLLNALVLLHAADNRLQRSSHIAWRIPRFELSPLSPKSLQLGARFVGIRNVLIIGVLKGHIFLHGCTVCLFRIMGSSCPGITKMMLTISWFLSSAGLRSRRVTSSIHLSVL